MHDLSASQAIVRTVLKQVKEKKVRRVLSLNLELGELTALNPEQIRFWLKELFKNTPAQGTKVYIKKILTRIKCKRCGYEGSISLNDDPFYHVYFPLFKCPECSSASLEIKAGRECLIRRMRVTT
ncbi:MAG: hydrogenase maturation nickel metallochaperone HypA [bacterium]